MRVSIDPELCQGAGECLAIAPDRIELDELGVARLTAGDDLPDELAERLERTCPSMAITTEP